MQVRRRQNAPGGGFRRPATVAWWRAGRVALGVVLMLASLCFALGAVAGGAGQVHVTPRMELAGGLQPPPPPTATFPEQLVLDDNSAESVVGLFGATSRQFLWFNRFAAGDVELQEVWVFFPQGQGVQAGDAIQIVIYQDADGDPTNGASLVFSLDTTVQVANGIDFSIYPIPPTLINGGDTLVGVVPRYIQSGVTPPTSPAALDSSSSQASSYLAIWLGDPPNPPSLPTDDDILLIDSVVGGGGNWTIRAFGVAGPSDIPVATPAGLAMLSLLLATAAFVVLRQRRLSSGSEPTWRRR